MTGYSARAQPYLDAIAKGAFSDAAIRDWLIAGTWAEVPWRGSVSLHEAQAARRLGTKQPFYCNYWCGRDSRCSCRPDGSRAIESDMLLFFGDHAGRRLCIHVEFKYPGEPLRAGQAEAYPMRAACWADRDTCPRRVLPHDAWLTAIVCEGELIGSAALTPFQRQIGHCEARARIAGYPS